MNESHKRKSRASSNRYARLRHLHGVLAQLVMHEGRFVSERTNNFLLFNSIFFTGFLFLATQVGNTNIWISALKVVLPVVGLGMSFLHSTIIARTINAADFWRSSIGLIEQDPDFWGHAETSKDIDLDIFGARRRYLNGIQTRQAQHPLKLSQLPRFIENLSFRFFHPNQISGFWLPSLIGILWLLALIWSCIQIWN